MLQYNYNYYITKIIITRVSFACVIYLSDKGVLHYCFVFGIIYIKYVRLFTQKRATFASQKIPGLMGVCLVPVNIINGLRSAPVLNLVIN